MNRGSMGSGHGWIMGWRVAWNNVAKNYVIQMPPGSANWAIGNRGEQLRQKIKPTGPARNSRYCRKELSNPKELRSPPQVSTSSNCASASARKR